jgi:hypothetical protein
MVLVVVPGEKVLTETARILNGAETIRVIRPVLHGFDVGFGKRVVVGNVGAAVGLDDAEIGEQQG